MGEIDMNYVVQDVTQFQLQKEFIDTAIVPLVRLNFSETGMKQSSSEANYLMSLTSFIEQQFRGRVMLIPPISYTEKINSAELAHQLHNELLEGGFKTVFFVTTDFEWTKVNDIHVIWLPAIPLESMDSVMKTRILQDQLQQIIPKLTAAWTS